MVLVASKDEKCLQTLAAGLKPTGGMLQVARDTPEIFDRISEDFPDFLVLDLETTDLKPSLLVSLIHWMIPSLKVIALTGHSTEEDAAVIEKGVFYYMSKPVGRELLELIQASA